MRGAVPVPGKGQPMKAAWGAAGADRVNSLCAMAPAGMLARDGVGGMGAQPLPANLRERRKDGGDGVDEDTKYGCDERSISLIKSVAGDSPQHGHHFYLSGFGKFTVHSEIDAIGTYAPSSVLDLGGEATTVAVLARVGESSSPDSNMLGYYRLRIPGVAPETSCFDIKMVSGVPWLVRCYYNVGGITWHSADVDLSVILAAPEQGSILAFAKMGHNGPWGAKLFSDESALHAAQYKAENYVVPLYVMAGSGAAILVDLRNAPQIQMAEGELT